MGIELDYFGPVRGRAEAPRLMLEYRNVPYTYVSKQFGDQKDAPFGQLPVLKVDGKTFAQSGSIVRYLAWTHDLVPSTTDQEAIAICDAIYELSQDMAKLNLLVNLFSGEQLTSAIKEEEGKVDKYLDFLTRDLKGPFIMGDKITYADFGNYHVCDHILALYPAKWEKAEKLVQWHKEVSSLPGVSKYLDSRGPLPEARQSAITAALEQCSA